VAASKAGRVYDCSFILHFCGGLQGLLCRILAMVVGLELVLELGTDLRDRF